MLDRIDIHVEVPPVEYEELASRATGESSAAIRERVVRARELQLKRYQDSPVTCNAGLPAAMLREVCVLEPAAEKILRAAFDRLGLSARGYDRILKVARTIADLDSAEKIAASHISGDIQFRSLDRKYWAS
jgi:magnesium chelatase family protein